MKRLVLIPLVAAALAAGCGGGEDETPAPAAAKTGATEAQLAFREQLLEEIERGEYKCHCTSAIRARERIAKGLAEAPP